MKRKPRERPLFRRYSVARDLRGGCMVCHAGNAVWFGPNAQGVAARHHDATGHQTWVDVVLMIRYGGDQAKSAS